jgi:ribosome-associated translation inhibitor RaiA
MLTENLQLTETDMTIFFRKLSEIKKQQTIEDAFELIKESFYKIERSLTKQKMRGCTGLPNI